MRNTFADVRFAARTLLRSPWFSALAVITLAAGIGATTALFSLVDAVLLRPLPFKDPHQLVEIWGRNDQRTGMRVPGEILEALRARAKTLQSIGTHDPSGGVLPGAEGSIDIRGEAVSANFVDVYGVQPVAGRPFMPADEHPGAPAVMLVSFAFWQLHLAGDSNAVGRPVYLDGAPYTVIGIMPPAFNTTFLGGGSAFWTPYAGNRSRERERELGYELVARLAPGVTLDVARREIEAIASAPEFAAWRKDGRRIGLVPLTEEVVGNRAYALTLLLAAAGLTLAVACANLAQLLLARSDGRVREFATRKAIGAGSLQVFRLALFESLLLSLAGGAAGILTAYWLVPLTVALAPVQIPRLVDASIDARVLAMALIVSLVTGCVFGLAPAWRLSRLSMAQAMKPVMGAASAQRRRLRSALVVIQVAAAVILVVLAGLVTQTFLTLLPASPGFASESRAAFIWSINERQFPETVDRRRRAADWTARLEAVPGVHGVAVGSRIPFGDDESRDLAVRRTDDDRPPGEATLRTDFRAVSLDFFRLLEIPVVRGRSFETADRADAPRVAIVNQTLARRLDPAGNVLGRSIRLGTSAIASPYEIVGVVADTRWWGMTLEPLNEVYTTLAQDRVSYGFVIVHSQLDTGSLTRAIRTSFYDAWPGAALPPDRGAIPLDEMIGRSVAGPRFIAVLIGSFSTMTVILAVTGLFGLVAYSLSQRRRELGIRVALGARPADLLVMSMRWGIGLTVVGIASGLLLAMYLTRFLESQLYGLGRLDLWTFTAAAIVMLGAAALATYLPARTAAYTDPMTALRYE